MSDKDAVKALVDELTDDEAYEVLVFALGLQRRSEWQLGTA